jgi:hypothetical protein
VAKRKFVLDKIESGIIEDPTETAPLQHPEVMNFTATMSKPLRVDDKVGKRKGRID